jgi:hypothetical protein
MKLIRAEFSNFRLLRDLTIDFSGEKDIAAPVFLDTELG